MDVARLTEEDYKLWEILKDPKKFFRSLFLPKTQRSCPVCHELLRFLWYDEIDQSLEVWDCKNCKKTFIYISRIGLFKEVGGGLIV